MATCHRLTQRNIAVVEPFLYRNARAAIRWRRTGQSGSCLQ